MLKLKIVTPKKVVSEREVTSITAPTIDGEITILSRHQNLFTMLNEGIVTLRTKNEEEFLAVGGGYLETDGDHVQILVSRAYGQNEIDQEFTQKALDSAKNILTEAKDKVQRSEAMAMMRRSMIDLKLLKKRRKTAL